LHFSKTHDYLGAAGIIFNFPFWNTASIFVNQPAGGSVKDQAFTANIVATFKPGEVNVNSNKITNVADPVNAQDAATKAYVDALFNQMKSATITVFDADGNCYPVVQIGTQFWMGANLRTTKYNDGIPLQLIEDAALWSSFTTPATPAYCWYDNNEGAYGGLGALYNWYAVNTCKLCPSGWHVPSDAEWTTLTNYLGGEIVALGKMISVTGWESPNTGETNESGFSALPGGYRFGYSSFGSGSFSSLGNVGGWWSSTENFAYRAWNRKLGRGYSNVSRSDYFKEYGFSVRCVRD